jgi:hypothetical protein
MYAFNVWVWATLHSLMSSPLIPSGEYPLIFHISA